MAVAPVAQARRKLPNLEFSQPAAVNSARPFTKHASGQIGRDLAQQVAVLDRH